MEEKKINVDNEKQAQPVPAAQKKKNNILLIILLAGLLVIIFALMIAGLANQKKAVEIAPIPVALQEAPKEVVVAEVDEIIVPEDKNKPVEEIIVDEVAPAPEGGPEMPSVNVEQRGVPAATSEPIAVAIMPAVPAVTAAVEPTDAKDFFTRGEDNYYKGKFDDAIADFKKSVELDPKYADAYSEMGVCFMEKTDWDSAIAQLGKAIEIDPNHPKAQYAIAVSYARKPQPDVKLAREHFEKSKQLGFVYPQWFEDFLKRLEAGERFPGQEGAK